MKLNELVCPSCGLKCMTDAAETTCSSCNLHFTASQSRREVPAVQWPVWPWPYVAPIQYQPIWIAPYGEPGTPRGPWVTCETTIDDCVSSIDGGSSGTYVSWDCESSN